MRPKQISMFLEKERKAKSLPGTCWTHVLSITGHSRKLTCSDIYYTLLKACVLHHPPSLALSQSGARKWLA